MTNKIQIKYDELEDLTRKVNRWIDRVDDLLTKSRLCQTMMDDGVWIGRGADKYRAELEGRAIPSLRKLLAALRDTHYGMLRANDTFRDAEETAARQIDRLVGVDASGIRLGADFNVSLGRGGGTIGGNSNISVGAPKPPSIGSNIDFTIPGFSEENGIGGNPNFTFPEVAPGPGGIGGNIDFTIPGFSEGNGIGGNIDFNIPGFGGEGGDFGLPDPRIPDIFPGEGGDIPRPDWYTEYSEDIDGFNGAVNGAVLLIDGGTSQPNHMGNIVGESVSAGGVPVSGMLVPQDLSDPRQAERAATAVGGFLANNPNAQIKLSPGLQALINGVATDSLGRSLMDMPSQAQVDAMRQFVEILKTTVEAFGRVLPGF